MTICPSETGFYIGTVQWIQRYVKEHSTEGRARAEVEAQADVLTTSDALDRASVLPARDKCPTMCQTASSRRQMKRQTDLPATGAT